ncbi:MAG: hypothetical protein KJN66_04440 [Bacteroidia bacterium]|nr:hypothetical protein [Bacteroidia bacterium]
MKTILVDAVNTFVIIGKGIDVNLYDLLETFTNRKIILTAANDEQFDEFGLHDMPYEVFTLKHNPEKTDTKYYKMMLDHFKLKPEDVIYFEHNESAVKTAKQLGIKTFYYNKDKKDLKALKEFLSINLK